MTGFEVLCYAAAAAIGWYVLAPILVILLVIVVIACAFLIFGAVELYQKWKRKKTEKNKYGYRR